MDIFKNPDIIDCLNETKRFVSHILLLYTISQIVNGRDIFFNNNLTSTIMTTILAVLVYHILFKQKKPKEEN
jgi:hypothetical protein